jgi:HAD superfamily hydrolase (TIGR01549 family)
MNGNDKRWVVLDVGETIIEESRLWTTWADELGIPRMTFMSVFGAIVERGLQYQHIRDFFAVDDWARHRDAVEATLGGFQPEDLYPDVLPTLTGFRELGYRTAIIGNQPAQRTRELRSLGVEAEVMAMSDEMGVAKPDPSFFSEVLALLGQPSPEAVAYVGDRIDNDVRPAHAAGMRAVWLRRGPWGIIPRQVPSEADLVIDSLAELAQRIDDVWR